MNVTGAFIDSGLYSASSTPNPIWYNSPYSFTAQNTSVLASGLDAPAIPVPTSYTKETVFNNINANNQLLSTNLVVSFSLTVAAETTDTSNGANNYYYGYANAGWTWSAQGEVGSGQANPPYQWQVAGGGGINTSPGWQATSTPYLVINQSSNNQTYFNSTLPTLNWN